jgi:hypothetical protein
MEENGPFQAHVFFTAEGTVKDDPLRGQNIIPCDRKKHYCVPEKGCLKDYMESQHRGPQYEQELP